jgi:glyoxalase family protein
MPEDLPGIHHVTCITGDVQKNVDFYVSVLGLRFIKKTVNFDVPDTYHLYFGDYLGTPGTAMTFFGWHHLPWGAVGAGQVSVVSFAVPAGSIEFWQRRLRDLGVETQRGERFGAEALVFKDPDQIELALVADARDDRWAPWPDGPVDAENAVRGFHSVTLLVNQEEPTRQLLTGTLGFREIARQGDRARYQTGAGGPGALLDVVESPVAARGDETTGTVHHVAWRALDDGHQVAWRDGLVAAGRLVTPVIERKYFRSIYFREPGGVLFEIATDGPGFTVDESPEALGSGLQLPPHAEDDRENLKFNLPPIVVPTVAKLTPAN